MAYLSFFLMAIGLFLVIFSLFVLNSGVGSPVSSGGAPPLGSSPLPVSAGNGHSSVSLADGEELPMVVKGVLYFNPSRSFSPQLGATLHGLAAMAETHRIGKGTMVMEKSGFNFHTGNTTYNYYVNDLDRIEFHNRGLLLIPEERGRPVAIFITEKPEEIRRFIKQHSTLKAS